MIDLLKQAVGRIAGRSSSVDPVETELARLASRPRYTKLSTDLLGFDFDLVDGMSFCSSYRSIMQREVYRFDSKIDDPTIIDCGANVGVSIVYFKRLYPRARIIAFEADPEIFATLQRNVARSPWDDVALINKVVWTGAGDVEFWREGSDAGRITHGDFGRTVPRVRLPAVRLRDFLDSPVDLLKLDIEGAETDVLLDCANRLTNVGAVFVEYHSFAGSEQRLDVLLSSLKAAGFRVLIQTEMCPPQPLIERRNYLGMDLQLNVFGVRAGT
jgi:FkbM family methyltransferase